MNKEYRRYFRQYLMEKINKRLPEFKRWIGKTIYLWPGEHAFYSKISEDIFSFIVFSPHEKRDDAFTVEIGWSIHGRFPELDMRPIPRHGSHDEEFAEPEFLKRLGELIKGDDVWWRFTPNADYNEAVKVAVDRAIDDVEGYGLPYLELYRNYMVRKSLL